MNPTAITPAENLTDGVTVRMGGHDFVIPPLSLRQVRDLLPKIRSLKTMGTLLGADEAEKETIVAVVHAAVSRNYPQMTRDALLDYLDLGNTEPAFLAVLAMSGMSPKDASPGEAKGPISP